ncbi:MAG: glycoside hydrolase family 11 protein [Treponema sp.]|jgi:hypothetical protein|nr:glycoside hydrolase family 11 protein [Treponema sp.]
MKKFLVLFVLIIVISFTVCDSDKEKETLDLPEPCTQNVKLSGGTVFNGNSGGNKSLPGSPYGYEVWALGGNNNLTWYGPNQGGGAAFRAEWNNANMFLGRVGYFWNEGKRYTGYGNVYCDFNFTRSPNGTAGGWSYLGIYGWSKNSLVEYYIVDDWYGNGIIGPANIGGGAVKKGEFTVDGSLYVIYQALRVNEPSIEGNQTFPQYFSIRQNRRQCGTISITEHFKQWEKIGMKMGTNMYEAKFLVEAGGSAGWFDASYIKFYRK